MKIALIGATGFVGSHILTELLNRGHQVTVIVRDPSKIKTNNPHLHVIKGDVLNENEVAAFAKGSDLVISAYNPGWTNPNIYKEYLQGAKAIQAGVKKSGVKRLIVIGGAGSLFVAPDLQLVDTPQFAAEWKPGALGARDYLDILKKENDLDWTLLSPAIEMHPGTAGIRKGTYRVGSENPVFDANGRSVISVEDVAVAIADEAELPRHIKKRFTVAW